MKRIIFSLLIIVAFIALNVYLYILIKNLEITDSWFCLSTAITFGLFWLSCKFLFKELYGITCNNNFTECEVNLSNYQLNGNGTTIIGKFGQYGSFYRAYQCFCILYIVPLFPLDCVVRGPIVEVENDGWFDSTASFAVLGTSPWYPLEVAVLMWRPWAIMGCAFALYDIVIEPLLGI